MIICLLFCSQVMMFSSHRSYHSPVLSIIHVIRLLFTTEPVPTQISRRELAFRTDHFYF